MWLFLWYWCRCIIQNFISKSNNLKMKEKQRIILQKYFSTSSLFLQMLLYIPNNSKNFRPKFGQYLFQATDLLIYSDFMMHDIYLIHLSLFYQLCLLVLCQPCRFILIRKVLVNSCQYVVFFITEQINLFCNLKK